MLTQGANKGSPICAVFPRFNAPALSLIIVHILCIRIICIAIWKMRLADIFTTILATSSTYTVI